MSTPAGLPEATIHTMLRETLSAIPLDPDMNDEDKAMLKESVALTLATLAPRDPSQVMLAQRIVVAHHAAMECLAAPPSRRVECGDAQAPRQARRTVQPVPPS